MAYERLLNHPPTNLLYFVIILFFLAFLIYICSI